MVGTFGLASARAITALERVQRIDELDGRQAGDHSRPQLVSTLDRMVEVLLRLGQLEALGSWFATVARALRARWPDADVVSPDDHTLRERFQPDH